jgi:signal peptidase I
MSMVYTDVKYGDIIVIDNDKNYLLNDNGEAYVPDQKMQSTLNQCIIKRVIACEGQTIDISDNKVTVDGKVIDEPYIAAGSTTNDLGAFTGQYPITIPKGYCFVMGDNRNGSTDSRDSHVGLISKKQIYGKAIIRYYPLKNFKFLFNSWKESAND